MKIHFHKSIVRLHIHLTFIPRELTSVFAFESTSIEIFAYFLMYQVPSLMCKGFSNSPNVQI